MHGDVEQEGLYQNCVFHYRWGRGFAPRAGQTLNISKFFSASSLKPLHQFQPILAQSIYG